MRRFAWIPLVASTLFAGALLAQDAWRNAAMQLPQRPGPNVTAADIDRVNQNALLAGPYFATLTPGDYEANREVVRRMATYLIMVEAMNNDPAIQQALGRAYRSVAALRWAVPFYNQAGYQQPRSESSQPGSTSPAAINAPVEPRFARQSPDLTNLAAQDRPTANDLSNRYELAAAKASVAWKSAGVIRANLESRGMTLNAITETSLARIELYFDLVSDALRAGDWAEARANIERAEYETEKVSKTVGR